MTIDSFDVQFSGGVTKYQFGSSVQFIDELKLNKRLIFITDEIVSNSNSSFWSGKEKIVIKPGEGSKNTDTIEYIFEQLLALEADRKTMLVGVGGGVVTDIVGFVASTYMRGVQFGFIPTSLLAMVDAAIGGKNGVNIGLHKNMMGCIRQPQFLMFDVHWLQTLPREEWSNGFAEIIKYGCIFNETMFRDLASKSLSFFVSNIAELQAVIHQCVLFKNQTVIKDEFETNERKLLNFGHTLAHPIESIYGISHGKAVAVGMVFACRLSEMLNDLPSNVYIDLTRTLKLYELPDTFDFDIERTISILKMDKKKAGNAIEYITLKRLGEGVITKLELSFIEKVLYSCKQ